MFDSLFEFLSGRGSDRPADDVRFSDELRAVVQRTREEAVRLGSPYIGTEHVILAMLASPQSEASRLFTSVGLRVPDLRSELEAATATIRESAWRMPRKGAPSAPAAAWTDKAKHALMVALKEARELEQDPVASGHLLLGVLGDPTSVAGSILAKRGLTLKDARALVKNGIGPHAELHIEIDDSSDQLIYAQIIAQIQERIATGLLTPGQRLPPIRQLADELGVAPGTVARAYNELETAGILVTDRARGTFVAGPRQAASKTRPIAIRDLLRPAVIAAFHLGASADELRSALEEAMVDIYPSAA